MNVEVEERVEAQKINNVTINVDKFVKRIMATKKVNVKEDEVRKVIETMKSYIDYFNSLDEFTSTIWSNNADISKVNILNEFKDFVIPAAVRIDATDIKCANLVRLNEVKSFGSFSDFINLNDQIRGLFKSDASSNVSSLADLKKSENLSSIIDRASVKKKVAYKSSPFVPVRLNYIADLFEDRYFNGTEDEVISDYIDTCVKFS